MKMALAIASCALLESAALSVTQARPDDAYETQVAQCLSRFDARAQRMKLGVESYQAAIAGACATEHHKARTIYSIRLSRNPNAEAMLAEYDQEFTDAKAALVTNYIMGNDDRP